MFLSLHSKMEVLKMVAPELYGKYPQQALYNQTGAESGSGWRPKMSPFGWVVSSVTVPQPSQAKDSRTTYSITVCQKWGEGNSTDIACAHGASLATVRRRTRRRTKPAMASAKLSHVGQFRQCKIPALPSEHELSIAKLTLDKQLQTASKERSATRTVKHQDTLNPIFYGWGLVMMFISASIVYALHMVYTTLQRMAQMDRKMGRQTFSIAIMDCLAYFRYICKTFWACHVVLVLAAAFMLWKTNCASRINRLACN